MPRTRKQNADAEKAPPPEPEQTEQKEADVQDPPTESEVNTEKDAGDATAPADTNAETERKDDGDAAESKPETEKKDGSDAMAKHRERMERFKALQQRHKVSTERNLKATAAETQRMATDPALMNNLSRRHAFASHNLLKADTEAAGDDFERKRAWDWTAEESEKWDRRLEKKQRHRDDVAFSDYTQDARKVYERQVRQMNPDLESYEREKQKAIEKAAARGDLEIVETKDGEMIAVDKKGTFYSTEDSMAFLDHKPTPEALDRLVADLQKAEDVRLKKRKQRRGDDDGDVTYINEKNKQFNQKLSRFYDKYTGEIRDSFERGTMM
ncbi:Pre-mRNA-splicing factor syf2 [Penicillium argentinense]|uniref:Pre-mRNA-splicing factor SYF2 n=1 Tax=Penicillium argentinense TaxID=1131581 RepID=A0A9W9K2E7_9EURO|nr:Pre-mRNA-splicing factor syf2 [Penicillium argentinense]KAJ5090300.1 Pre-mRNA-splicing factor syf2 [Penicillium argentinense]